MVAYKIYKSLSSPTKSHQASVVPSCSLPQGCARKTFPRPSSVTWTPLGKKTSNELKWAMFHCHAEGQRILYIDLSMYPSIYRSIHPSIHLSIHVSIYLSVCLFGWLSVCLSVWLAVCLSVFYMHIYIYMYVCMHVCMYMHMYMYMYMYISIQYMYISIYI